MALLPTSADIVDPSTTFAEQKVNFDNLIDFLTDLLGTDSANKFGARAALGAVGKTGVETISGVKTLSDVPVLPIGTEWHTKAIGEIFYLRDDWAEVNKPPTDNANYRYIKLTASDAYNSSVLTSESVTGSAPLITATAVISLSGSPLNGKTINLLNTERRFIRSGSSGTLEDDMFKSHTHVINGSGNQTLTAGSNAAVNFQAGAVSGATGGTETRPRNQGATAYMRIK